MSTSCQVFRWGGGLAVRIPIEITQKCGIQEGSAVELIADGDTLALRKPTYDLDSLLDQITLEDRHEEIDWSPPQGKEVW